MERWRALITIILVTCRVRLISVSNLFVGTGRRHLTINLIGRIAFKWGSGQKVQKKRRKSGSENWDKVRLCRPVAHLQYPIFEPATSTAVWRSIRDEALELRVASSRTPCRFIMSATLSRWLLEDQDDAEDGVCQPALAYIYIRDARCKGPAISPSPSTIRYSHIR